MLLVRVIGLFCILLLTPLLARAESVLDLSVQDSKTNLASMMQVLDVAYGERHEPYQILDDASWVPVEDTPAILAAPREQSSIWLRVVLSNDSDMPLYRWLEISPWALDEIDAWLLVPGTRQTVGHWRIGADVPVESREVKTTRAVVPVSLNTKEQVLLLLHVRSNHRPALGVTSWNPVDFVIAERDRYQKHSVLFAIVLTLFVVLLLQHNLHYLLLACWMLALFFLEAEKEGYISYLLFSEQSDIGLNIRFMSSLLEKSLFIAASVFFLGLNKHPYWRWVPIGVLGVTFLASVTGFFLDGVAVRRLASGVHIFFALLWLCIVPAAIKISARWQPFLIGLLSLNWLITTLLVMSFALNIRYSLSFSLARVGIEIMVIMGLLLIYVLKQREYERMLELQLRESEKAERDRLERAVVQRTRELNQALDAAHKADASKTKFLSRVTHDLKSPLTSIMGYSQLLSTEQGKTGQMSHIIYDSASHMLNLINRLIDYARDVTSIEMNEVDLYLHAFINNVSHEGRILAGKNNNGFRLEVDELLPSVIRCDETLLREVLLNLLDNAAKYTVNGDITLRIYDKNTHESDKGAVLHLVCEVEDTGCGIDAEEHDQLFDPLFRVSDKGEGTGLGLAIVKELVERMGGDIFLSSVPNKGTCVRFTVPVKPGREDAGIAVLKSPTRMLPLYNADGLEAWVVEDSEQIRHLLYMELSELGFTVVTFADAESAINALQAKNTMPDIILTDYRLPKASGGAVLEAARAIDPLVPVLLLSATWYLQPERQETGECYTALLGKPVDLALLRHEVARACGLADIQASNSSEAHSSGSVTASSIVINEDSIQQLEVWLELGAVTDITEWCEQLGKQHPESACFAEELSALAQRGDFKAIHRRLLELS